MHPIMFSPPPSHPLGDAFSDSFRNRKENFHRWCMKQLNHNRAWKRGFEFQKDYRSSDLKVISKLDLYATVFRGKTSERILKMWKLSVLMQIKNMKSTLNQLMNLLQVETVLQVLLLLYVSNKINLSQVHISSFFICNILMSFNCLDFIFTIVPLHNDERSTNLFFAWRSAGAFALAWVVILLLQLSFFRTHCQCLQNVVQWLGFWKTYNHIAVHPVCAIYFFFWSDCKMKSISIYSDSGNSQLCTAG
jgi:hypothetical protein